MSDYKTVIGLEIHAELLTQSKVFCTCSAEFGGDQNSRCCPVCTGMPGTLPVINQTAVEYAVKAGFALGCDINKFSVFDRKNYFYPDLPKAYQISQLNYPLCIEGLVPIEVNGVKKNIRINRIHLEEDAGKLTHDNFNAVSLADYNRCGIPLIEIVTEPDISSAEEAKAFFEEIVLRLQYAGVCDCKLEQGSIRCDVNISLMKPDAKEFGTRAEIKNLNSIKSIGRAIEYEEKRQARLLDAGKRVIQETRRYNDNRDETKSMRSKENAHDYRYFPEPDILQVNFTDEMLDAIKAKLPVMPTQRLAKYTEEYGLSEVDAKIIVNTKIVSDFYDKALEFYNNPKSVATFILSEFMRRVNLGEIDINNLSFSAEEFAKLVKMADGEKVSKNDAKTIFRYMVETGKGAEEIARENGFIIEIDTEKVSAVIDEVLGNNSAIVEQYKNGETKVVGFLIGQCSKALKGSATPKVIKETLEAKLAGIVADTASTAQSNDESTTEKVADTSKLTPYRNEDAYKPNSLDDKLLMIDGNTLVDEFDLDDAVEKIGEKTVLSGCVHRVKNMGSISFIVIRTARYVIQTVYNPDNCADSIEGLREGQFVRVSGVIKENLRDTNGLEIELSSIKLISCPASEYPLKIAQGKLNCSLDVNLDNRSVALRSPYERAIFKLQEGVVHGFSEFMSKNGFTEIHTPKIVAQGAEGGANIFHIDYFNKPAFLNQSPQFYKQTAVAFFDRVYEIAPVYRAEKHATSRHINEYIGLDFEMGYIDSMYDVMAMETAMLRYVCEYLKANYASEIKILNADIPSIKEIPSIKFIDAVELLRGKGSKITDLEPEDEVALCEYAKKTFDSDFIFVTHFPSSKPPFYAMNSREDSREAYKFDLLFRGLEITSGGQRIHDYNEQIEKMLAQGLNPDDFKSYLEAHKYGLPPHGGLGIGLERLLMKLLNLSNIRTTSMFPRDINRLLP